MKPGATASALLLMALAYLCLPLGASGQRQQQKEWTWTDSDDNVRLRADLDKIRAQHKLWVESDGKSGVQADLSGADLREADLDGVNLGGAQLFNVNLHGAHLSGADLSKAKLSLAQLSYANLNRADLRGADLSDAQLGSADLTGAALAGTYVSRAVFEPKNLPTPDWVTSAYGLELMRYLRNPGPLTQLRKQFQDAGYREQERKIIYALNRHDANPVELRSSVDVMFKRIVGRSREYDYAMPLGSFIAAAFKWIAFDLTCQYGLTPGRPLLILLVLWLVLSGVYGLFIHWPGRSGIIFIANWERNGKSKARSRRIRPQTFPAAKWWKLPFLWLRREWRVLRAALFFSLLSAFDIGFHEFTFGSWLRKVTKREYNLKAVGWTRTVSGLQSLLSVYMIALWVLTYFGRPFG